MAEVQEIYISNDSYYTHHQWAFQFRNFNIVILIRSLTQSQSKERLENKYRHAGILIHVHWNLGKCRATISA